FAESNDGITWTVPVAMTENPDSPLTFGDFSFNGQFFKLWAPGTVLYNSNATSVEGYPYSFPYAMTYDVSPVGSVDFGGSPVATALAYSSDGKNWTRFG